jgi:hypothetical protein
MIGALRPIQRPVRFTRPSTPCTARNWLSLHISQVSEPGVGRPYARPDRVQTQRLRHPNMRQLTHLASGRRVLLASRSRNAFNAFARRVSLAFSPGEEIHDGICHRQLRFEGSGTHCWCQAILKARPLNHRPFGETHEAVHLPEPERLSATPTVLPVASPGSTTTVGRSWSGALASMHATAAIRHAGIAASCSGTGERTAPAPGPSRSKLRAADVPIAQPRGAKGGSATTPHLLSGP